MSVSPESNFSTANVARRSVGQRVAPEKEKADDEAMSERVATLEATIGTIRAEMRANQAEIQASNAETRGALLGAFERLRTDTNREVMGVKIWILSSVVTGLLGLLGVGWLIAQQYLIHILQHTH